MQNSPDNENKNAPDGVDDKSSLGIKPNIAATLSYALVWIVGVISNMIIGWIALGQIVPQYYSKEGLFRQLQYEIATGGNTLQIKLQIAGIVALFISGVITCGAGFVFFTMEKESRWVRLHTIQAILFFMLTIVAYIVVTILSMALGPNANTILTMLLGLIFLVIWILLMVKAYKGNMFKLPFISDLAENIVTK